MEGSYRSSWSLGGRLKPQLYDRKEILHADDLAATTGSASRQFFLEPLKEHNQVICAGFCFRLFFSSLCTALCATERRNRKHANE